ncbi:MAG: SET domain-containing protein-lysine N-methyltransferase [Myxococcota bacterium]|nr:SET domain-containing protein-lysine N-methyltransferase [Myxococcota bacterium]
MNEPRMPRLERVEARVSPIHGRGVFAGRRVRRGGYVGTFEGRPTRRDGMYVLWVIDEDDHEVGVEGKNELRFLNHSSEPNAEFVGLELYALRNIQPGCEVTIHYGDEWRDVD